MRFKFTSNSPTEFFDVLSQDQTYSPHSHNCYFAASSRTFNLVDECGQNHWWTHLSGFLAVISAFCQNGADCLSDRRAVVEDGTSSFSRYQDDKIRPDFPKVKRFR